MVRTYGLTHINLAVRDVERSLRFYRQVFGVEESRGRYHIADQLFNEATEIVEAILSTTTTANAKSSVAGSIVVRKYSRLLRNRLLQAIFMMQAAEHRRLCNTVARRQSMSMARGRNSCLNRFRKTRSQGRVWPTAIVVGDELTKDALQMPLVQGNQVVQALAPNAANYPFAISIRHRAPDRCLQHS